MIDKDVNECYNILRQDFIWKETMFQNVDYYYFEHELHGLRVDKGTTNERVILIKARSMDDAITLGVMGHRTVPNTIDGIIKEVEKKKKELAELETKLYHKMREEGVKEVTVGG